MTDKFGAGQADKAAAEERTAEVSAQDKASVTKSVPPQAIKLGAEGDSAAERVLGAEGDLVGDSAEVVDPYPAYEAKSLDELRSLAQSRKVEINRDAEKAQLVAGLRAQDPTPAWDLMPLDQLREKASSNDVELDPEWEFAHWVTELRAADTHTR